MQVDPKHFDGDEILAGILDWVKVESPTYHRDGVNQLMTKAADEMTAFGAAVTRTAGTQGFGDIVTARFNNDATGSRPGILVTCHLDTVHTIGTLDNQLPIRNDGDKVYGPGIYDMKGGARLAIEAWRAIRAAGLQPTLPVTYLFTPDEEIGSPTSRDIIESEAKKNHYILVPEPLRPSGDVVVGRHAIQRFIVRTIGKPSHAGSTKRDGRSAIAQMARVIERIEALNDYDRHVTYAVGTVHGGTFVNVVAIECEAQVLCVAPTDDDLAEVRQKMRDIAGEEDGVRIEVEQTLCRPISRPHPGTMALFDIAKSLGAEIDIELTHCLSGGGSDGNFTGALELPTLDGLGVAGAGAHTFNEHLLVSSLVPRCRILAELLLALDKPA